jgi:hypothetical protein
MSLAVDIASHGRNCRPTFLWRCYRQYRGSKHHGSPKPHQFPQDYGSLICSDSRYARLPNDPQVRTDFAGTTRPERTSLLSWNVFLGWLFWLGKAPAEFAIATTEAEVEWH